MIYNGNKKFKIGIIGTGGIAHAHMQAYRSFSNVEVVALADIVPGRADAFAKEFGLEHARIYPNDRALIDAEKDLDGVSICTYNRQHAAPTIYALEHGVHVLLEKPMCVTLDEAVAMRRAEKESGKILTIGFQPRFDKNMQMIKNIVQSGELGHVYYIQTGGGRRRGIPANDNKTSFIEADTAGIGALADIGCYSLDMCLNAIGYPKPLTVSGFKTDFFGKDPKTFCKQQHPDRIAAKFGVDDFAGAFIRLEGGVYLDFRIAWAMNVNTPGDTILLGTKAGLRIPSTDCWNGTTGGPMTLYRQVAGEPVEETIPLLKDGPNDGTLWERKIASFLEAIEYGTAAPVPTEQIIINQAIIDGIVRSDAEGREVEIQIPEI